MHASGGPTEFAFPALRAPEPPPTVRDLDRLLGDARAEADAIRAQAREAGWAEGHAAGRAEALAQLEPAVRALTEALQEASLAGAQLAESLEHEAVELALMTAEKVVAASIRADPERVLDVVRGALRGIVDRRRITILVNPADLPLLREGMGALREELGGIEQCDVQAERRVGRGGALVRTADGEVDARLEAKLDRAADLLREAAS
ncbi:MAG: FliH/SctL family protein [Solirubrobacteraceae bacterium]|nr:FliH/SctL family protein [Solirubrobacteraceae bacterium]